MKICLLHCKYISFHEKETSFMYLSCTLKLHLAPFSHWERTFSASVALHSLHLLSCTKHSISVLSSKALVFLALKKSSKHEKSVFCIANNISFHEKETSFMYLSLTLKIAFSNFLSLRSFSASVALDSLHLLSCTKHSISVLRRSKPVILCIEALTWLALQKSSLATFSHWERSFSASLALHSLHLLSCTKHIISVLRSSKLVICALKLYMTCSAKKL